MENTIFDGYTKPFQKERMDIRSKINTLQQCYPKEFHQPDPNCA